MIEIHPFGCFVPRNAKYLLLGSFIGKITKDNNFDWFYGTKRNQFWPILREVYNLPLEKKEDKISLFSDLKMAVTDVILSCERKMGTNLDSNLINITWNNDVVGKILEENRISKIFFSSRFVEQNYKRHFKELFFGYKKIKYVTLPAPSPRYAALSLSQKVNIYKELLPPLIRPNLSYF